MVQSFLKLIARMEGYEPNDYTEIETYITIASHFKLGLVFSVFTS